MRGDGCEAEDNLRALMGGAIEKLIIDAWKKETT